MFDKKKKVSRWGGRRKGIISHEGDRTSFAIPEYTLYGRKDLIIKTQSIVSAHEYVIIGGAKLVGKTALACSIAKNMDSKFDDALYINISDMRNNNNESAFIGQLGMLVNKQNNKQTKFNDIFEEVIKNKKILFIFDNITESDGMVSAICSSALAIILKLIKSKQHVKSRVIIITNDINSFANIDSENAIILSGLEVGDIIDIFTKKNICITPEQASIIKEIYNGNPKYIILVADYCNQFCNGDIKQFLSLESKIIKDIGNLLYGQYEACNELEKKILILMSLCHGEANVQTIGKLLGKDFNDIISSLQILVSRGLLEKTKHYTLTRLMNEFVINHIIIRETVLEILEEQPNILLSFPMVINQATEDLKVKQRQIFSQIFAVIEKKHIGQRELLTHLYNLLTSSKKYNYFNYLAGNVINIIASLQEEIHDVDLSDSYICDADMENLELRNVNFTRAKFNDTSFKNIFGSVTALSFNKEYEWLATGFFSGLILVWDTYGNQIAVLQEFESTINDIKFFDDTLWACSRDGQVVEWKIQKNPFSIISSLRLKTVSQSSIRAIAIARKTGEIFAGSEDGVVSKWDLATPGQEIILLKKPYRIKCLALSSDEQWLAVAGDSSEVTMVNRNEIPNRFYSVIVDNKWIRCSKFFDKSALACGGDSGNINLVYILGERFKTETIYEVDKSKIWSIAYDQNRNRLITGGDDGLIKCWDISTRKFAGNIGEHNSWVRCLDVSNGKLFSGSEDQTIAIWNVCTLLCERKIRGYTKRVFSIDSSAAGVYYMGLGDHSVIRTEYRTSTTTRIMKCADQVWAISVKGKCLCAGCDCGEIYIFDLESNRVIFKYRFATGWIGAVKFDETGNWLAVGDESGNIYIFDVKNLYLIGEPYVFHAHCGRVATLVFQQENLFSIGEDGKIIKYNLKTREQEEEFLVSNNLLYAMDTIGDDLALIGGADGKVFLIQLAHLSSSLVVETGIPIWSLKVVSSDNFLVGLDNGEVREYSLNGELIRTIKSHTNQVWAIYFDAQSQLIISAGEDSEICFHEYAETTAEPHRIHGNLPYYNVNLKDCEGLSEKQINYLCIMGAITT